MRINYGGDAPIILPSNMKPSYNRYHFCYCISYEFYGLFNLGAALFGAASLVLFGQFLDRRRPNALYWYGWITYAIVYLGLLITTYPGWIFLIWTIQAYVSTMSVEYQAINPLKPQEESQHLQRMGENQLQNR